MSEGTVPSNVNWLPKMRIYGSVDPFISMSGDRLTASRAALEMLGRPARVKIGTIDNGNGEIDVYIRAGKEGDDPEYQRSFRSGQIVGRAVNTISARKGRYPVSKVDDTTIMARVKKSSFSRT